MLFLLSRINTADLFCCGKDEDVTQGHEEVKLGHVTNIQAKVKLEKVRKKRQEYVMTCELMLNHVSRVSSRYSMLLRVITGSRTLGHARSS